jgi:hypothetical protein
MPLGGKRIKLLIIQASTSSALILLSATPNVYCGETAPREGYLTDYHIIMTMIADMLYSRLAQNFRGFEACDAPKLYRDFVLANLGTCPYCLL